MRSNILVSAIWLGCAVAANLTTEARAATATVYTYSGNPFNVFTGPFDATMSVSGSFTMPDALPANQSFSFISPSSFSFSDGLSSTFNPVTNINANLVLFQFLQTDSFGNISGWDIQVAAGDYTIPGQETNTIISDNNFDEGLLTVCTNRSSVGTCIDVSTSMGLRAQTPGTWSSAPVATPLPATLPLFATGLGALGLLGWRRKRKAASAIAA